MISLKSLPSPASPKSPENFGLCKSSNTCWANAVSCQVTLLGISERLIVKWRSNSHWHSDILSFPIITGFCGLWSGHLAAHLKCAPQTRQFFAVKFMLFGSLMPNGPAKLILFCKTVQISSWIPQVGNRKGGSQLWDCFQLKLRTNELRVKVLT